MFRRRQERDTIRLLTKIIERQERRIDQLLEQQGLVPAAPPVELAEPDKQPFERDWTTSPEREPVY